MGYNVQPLRSQQEINDFYFACDGIKMWNVTFVLGFQHNDTFKQQHPNFDELVKLYEKT